jgi:hypothetical protein
MDAEGHTLAPRLLSWAGWPFGKIGQVLLYYSASQAHDRTLSVLDHSGAETTVPFICLAITFILLGTTCTRHTVHETALAEEM